MPFSFPASPTQGQQSTQNGRTYSWSGSAWELVAASGGSGLSWSSVPASATATGTAGSIAYDNANGFFYVATNTNTWKRAALSSWSVDPYWSSVSLLLNGDGNLTDLSSSPKTVTAYGGIGSGGDPKFGSASLSFSGSGQYLSVPYSSAFEFSSGDWTVECWAKATTLNSQNNLIAINGDAATSYAAVALYAQGDGSVRLLCQNSSGGWINTTPSAAGVISTGAWYHIAAVRSGSTFTVYVNGTSVLTYTSSASLGNASSTSTVGWRNGAASDSYWTGLIDELRITKAARIIALPTTAFPNA